MDTDRIPASDIDGSVVAFAKLEQLRGPSVREYQAAVGLNTTSAAALRLSRLEELGFIERIPTSARPETRSYRLSRAGHALMTDIRNLHADLRGAPREGYQL